MQLGVLSLLPSKKSRDLQRFMMAASHRNVELHIYHPQDLMICIEGNELFLLDREQRVLRTRGFLNRVPFDNTEEISLACKALRVPFINSADSVRTARNKMLTSVILSNAGISQPDTFYFTKAGKKHLLVLPDVPCVSKPKTGSHGKMSYKFMSGASLQRFVRKCKTGSELYLQRFVKNDGWDLRVVVVGGRVLGAVRKTAAPGEWRTHLAHGGTAEPFTLDKELAQLALKTAGALGLEIAGLDIMLDEKLGYQVLEANSVPGLGVFEETTGISMSGEIIDYMISLM